MSCGVVAEDDVRQCWAAFKVVIPPPLDAELPLKVTSVSVGLLEFLLYIRRGGCRNCHCKVKLVSVGFGIIVVHHAAVAGCRVAAVLVDVG